LLGEKSITGQTKSAMAKYPLSLTVKQLYSVTHSQAAMMEECPRCSVECSMGAYSLQSPPLRKTQSLSLRKV